jgi:hypothetical protein
MVKGNKERRQELSLLRREGKKAERERKRHGTVLEATGGEARARLLSDAKRGLGYCGGGAAHDTPERDRESGLIGWTVQANAAAPPGKHDGAAGKRKVGGRGGNVRNDSAVMKTICEHYFRSGFCEVRCICISFNIVLGPPSLTNL